MSAVNQLGKYQAYPEYKNSGVEWLGEVPSDWVLQRLKFLCHITTGDKDTVEREEEGLYPFFVRSDTVERISTYSFDGEAVLTAGDGAIGKIFHHINGKFDFHQRVYKFSDFKYVNGRYFYHYISNNLANEVIKLSAKTTVDSLRLPMLQNFVFVLPPIEHQVTIAAFLDYETARIDQLIAKQQQLIELLKEKRQAVISHAVTKGLNPNAPMKDSGVEWLGQVPEHWVVRRLKHHIISMDQGWSPQCEARLSEPGEFGVMKVGCVNGGIFRANEHKALPAELEPRTEYRLKKGQLLVSRANTRELVGSAAVVDADYGHLLLCDKLYRIKLSSDVSPDFVGLLLGTLAYRGQIELSASGASDSMQNIGQSTIKELSIAIPPFDEANNILKYLASKLATFDCLNSQLHQQNLLLQERRTALISAAVTGKIDLRGWQPPKSEEAA